MPSDDTNLIDAVTEAFGLAVADERLRDASGISARPDPLRKLLDDDFTETLWEYEFSRLDPEVPGSLHPKQTEALESDKKHRLLFWGNQSGKTTWGAVDTILFGLGRHPYRQWTEPPIRSWASALSWELWENILLPELLTWIPPSRIIRAPEPYVHSSNRLIEYRADNGTVSRIWGKSAEQGPGKYQSARIHDVWLDEEHPEPVWDELLPRLLRFGGTTKTTATPLKGLTWLYWRLYEAWQKGEDPNLYITHAGIADNPSIQPEEIEDLKRQLRHNPALLAARLYGKFAKATGLALNFDPEKHFEDWTDEELQKNIEKKRLRPFAGIDFGHWRFACVLLASDQAQGILTIDEVFSQRETLSERAEQLDALFTYYNCPPNMRVWGDSANPQDILEINQAFKRMEAPWRVVPVSKKSMEGKTYRRGSVDRLNDLFARNALKIRRGIGGDRPRDKRKAMVWRLGLSTASDGHAVRGSRLLWEMNNWCYPEKKEDRAQGQDPDDDTADGADAIAGWRYAILEALRPAKPKAEDEKPDRNRDTGLEEYLKRHERIQNRPVRSTVAINHPRF